jgi:hypothetical protein
MLESESSTMSCFSPIRLEEDRREDPIVERAREKSSATLTSRALASPIYAINPLPHHPRIQLRKIRKGAFWEDRYHQLQWRQPLRQEMATCDEPVGQYPRAYLRQVISACSSRFHDFTMQDLTAITGFYLRSKF